MAIITSFTRLAVSDRHLLPLQLNSLPIISTKYLWPLLIFIFTTVRKPRRRRRRRGRARRLEANQMGHWQTTAALSLRKEQFSMTTSSRHWTTGTSGMAIFRNVQGYRRRPDRLQTLANGTFAKLSRPAYCAGMRAIENSPAPLVARALFFGDPSTQRCPNLHSSSWSPDGKEDHQNHNALPLALPVALAKYPIVASAGLVCGYPPSPVAIIWTHWNGLLR